VLLAVGCSSGRTSGGSGLVTPAGRIGTAHLDRSDRAAVIRFAGRPSQAASLTIAFTGGVERKLFVTGAHVYAFVLHSRRNDAGVFDCM